MSTSTSCHQDPIWLDSVRAATALVSSYVHQSSCVWNTLLSWCPLSSLILRIFLPPLLHSSLSPEGRDVDEDITLFTDCSKASHSLHMPSMSKTPTCGCSRMPLAVSRPECAHSHLYIEFIWWQTWYWCISILFCILRTLVCSSLHNNPPELWLSLFPSLLFSDNQLVSISWGVMGNAATKPYFFVVFCCFAYFV